MGRKLLEKYGRVGCCFAQQHRGRGPRKDRLRTLIDRTDDPGLNRHVTIPMTRRITDMRRSRRLGELGEEAFPYRRAEAYSRHRR